MTSIQVLTLTKDNRVVSGPPTKGNSDASTVISPFADITRGTPTLHKSNSRLCDYSDIEKTVDDIETTYRSMNQISESLEAIVRSTQSAVMSDDRLLHQRVAQVYQDLSKAGTQIQQLKSSTARFKKVKKRITAAASNGNTSTSKFKDLGSRWIDLDERDSAVINIFFDCVSRFSSCDYSCTSVNEIEANFFGSPEYRFELLPSFYPEQYISEGSISKEVFAVAMLPATDSQQTLRYFLNYAENARRWQRVIVSAAFHGERKQTDTLQVAASDDHHTWGAPIALPSAVHSLLLTLLPFIEFHSSTTQISLDLEIGESGQITAESSRIEVIEEESEISEPDEKKFLRYISSVACERYVESDVITDSRIGSTSYKVYVDAQACVENKVLFASGKKQGINAFLDYLDEIKHCISLRRCANVSGLRGIILDDTKRHLRGYLTELPTFASAENLLGLANSRSNTIPWLVREIWARQLIEAIIDIHNQALIAGVFTLDSVGIKADGTAVLHRLQRSENYLQDRNGRTPPELRSGHSNGSAVRDNSNFLTDIFQLGLVVWLLMEHVPKGLGHFCTKSACTHFPRRTCLANHTNPIELPKCGENVPTYLCDIIRGCRLPDPQSRVSTSELAHMLYSTPQPDVDPAEIQQALMPYISSGYDLDHTVWCDECDELTTDVHFHCNLCESGDYDICQACFERGRRCLVPEHQLVKRARSKYDLIDISQH